jgi:hypothetical protein
MRTSAQSRVSAVAAFRWIVPQFQRCETMPARLAPTPELPLLSGSSTPNSVATLGPLLSCRLPGRRTCLRNAPAAVRLVGPDDESGTWPRPSSRFPSFTESVIKDRSRRDQSSTSVFAQRPSRLQFDFQFSRGCYRCIGPVEGAISPGRAGPCGQTQGDD